METLSYIALVLLSLVGYSGGVVGKAKKSIDLKPQLIDLILVLFIWTGAIFSRITMDVNKWFMILIWIFIGSLIGILSVLLRKIPKITPEKNTEIKQPSTGKLKYIWTKWKAFSQRMGSFQSKIILSLFFFLFVTPFALGVKFFSDPLRIKLPSSSTYWQPKKEPKNNLEEYRRQF